MARRCAKLLAGGLPPDAVDLIDGWQEQRQLLFAECSGAMANGTAGQPRARGTVFILTPDAGMVWDRRALHWGPGTGRAAGQPDDVEPLWVRYYGAMFNPDRVNTRVMRAQDARAVLGDSARNDNHR